MAPWHGMVKKHHAWKMVGLNSSYLYGEDLYARHSIRYGPMLEEDTFRAFASRINDYFCWWASVEAFAESLDIKTVPVLFEGEFSSKEELERFVMDEHAKPSALGGEREGIVIRTYGGFYAHEFDKHVAKSVRKNHVQTDEHWTKNWQPCDLIGV